MIKKIFLLISLSFLTNCITLQQMNSNMQEANELMAENIQVMQTSKLAIEENTRQIQRSTNTMQGFEFIFPGLFIIAILALIYICLKLRLFHRIFKNQK